MNRSRLKALLEEYGRVAIATYLVMFGLTFAGAIVALALGFNFKGAAGTAGLIGAAYLATKATQPIRIGATLLMTPVVARAIEWWRRRRGGIAACAPASTADAPTSETAAPTLRP